MFTIVSFYTENTPYEQEILGLMDSCNKLDLSINVTGIPNLGTWKANCRYKTNFLIDMVKKYKNQKIVYLDADARVQQYPTLFNHIDEDIAVHYRNNTELLSGTIFLNCNDNILRLVKEWDMENSKYPNNMYQANLSKILTKVNYITIKRLPATYCQIFDLMKSAGDPVIEHFQASRRFKQEVEL